MKRSSLAIVSALVFAAPSAEAADMALKAPPPLPAPIMSWTGLYIGANAGGGWANTEWQDNHNSVCPGNGGFNVASCDIPQKSNSFIGGGQLGARWQTGQWVVGLEGTADYAKFNSTIIDPASAAAGSTILTDTTRLRGLYTATAQAGIAWDRELWYVKGGWAGSRLTRDTLVALPGGNTEGGPVSQQASGWTVGTGLEYRLTSWPNFSIGLEYNYIHLNAGNVATCVTVTGTALSGFCGGGVGGTQPLQYNGFHTNLNEVLVRANYTFNWAAK
jgi:outer membrane immunogenic protein